MGLRSLWIPVGATALCLLLGGTAWVRRDQAEVRERLARFVAEHDAQQAEHRRDALYGETLDGNACDDYLLASQALSTLGLAWRHSVDPVDGYFELTQRGRALDDDARRAIDATLATALQSIRRGVHHNRSRSNGRPLATFLLQAVVDDALERAFAARDGQTLAELFVDRWVLRGDLWSQEIGRPLLRDAWLGVLDRDSAAWFANALRRLDERHCVFAQARDHIANCVREVADLTPLQQSFTMGLSAWRYGCDWYWRELVCCDLLLASTDELEPPAHDWTTRRAQMAFGRVIDDPEAGWAARIPVRVRGSERQLRTLLVHVRFLRLAVAFAHGLELPQLADPLGSGRIEVTIAGDGATFRSEGMVGKKRLERTVRRR